MALTAFPCAVVLARAEKYVLPHPNVAFVPAKEYSNIFIALIVYFKCEIKYSFIKLIYAPTFIFIFIFSTVGWEP